MIEVNFLDANGVKILSLNTIEDVKNFFQINSGLSNVPALIFELMFKHDRCTINGNDYFFHNTHIDALGGMNTVSYSLL